jgi:hypothetical protein
VSTVEHVHLVMLRGGRSSGELAKLAKIKDEWRVLRHVPAPPGGP